MVLLKGWLSYRPVWVTLLIVVLMAGWQTWNVMAAPGRISPALQAAIVRQEPKLNIVIQTNFKLEAFHINYFQGRGRVSKVEERQILLRGIPPAEVQDIARNYWVARLLLADEVK